MNTRPSPSMSPTPFHLRTARLCLSNAWVGQNGWTKVDFYTDVLEEYWALRNGAGIHDLTGLLHYRIVGADASSFLDYLTTVNVGMMPERTARHVLWCDDQGHVVGDGILYRLKPDEFRLFTQQSSYLWFADASVGFATVVEDVSRNFGGLAIQGPDARNVLQAVGLTDVAAMAPMEVVETTIQNVPVLVGRVSSGAELGYELFVDANDAPFLWDELAHHRILLTSPVGVSAFHTAMVEAGHPRLGFDFLSSETTIRGRRSVTPMELDMNHRVDFNKPHFIGRRALEQKWTAPPHQKLCGITYDGPGAFSGCPIRSKGTDVGATTSIVWSPKLARHVGLAWILTSAMSGAEPLELHAHIADELKAEPVSVPVSVGPRRHYRSATFLETPVAVA